MALGGALIGALRVTLGLDSAQFEAGTRRARQVAQRDATAIQKSLAGIKTSFNGLIAAATIASFTAVAKRALEYASSLGEVAQQLGVTTKELQEYRYAGSQVGISNEEMDKSLAKLTRTIGEAKAGSKEQATAFRDLGVAIQDANGRVYTAGEVIPKVADALSRIKDPATRARYEVELFGKAGQKLDTLLAGGSAAINNLRDAARKLGIVLSDDQIQHADDTADKLAALKQVLEARIAGVVADNASAILSLANALAELANAASKIPPQILGVLGGSALGGRFGGLPGALLGAAGGLVVGERVAQGQEDANMDPVFRAKRLKSSIATWRQSRQGNPMADPGGKMGAGSITAQNQRSEAAWAEVERQWALFNQAKAAAAQPSATATTVKDGALPIPKGTPKRAPKDRTQEKLERFNRELAGLQDDELQYRQQITTDVSERARLEHERIDRAKEAYDYDVDSRVKQGDLTKAQGEELKTQYAINAEKANTLVNWRLDDDLTEQELEARRASLENSNALLQGELDAARTQKERRRIQLAILANERDLEKAALEAVIAKHDSTEAEKDIARAKLAQLDREYAQRGDAVRRDTMGPMEAYLNSLPSTADELREKFESIKVDALNNSLDVAVSKVVKLKGVAGELFNQLIADVIRLQLQAALTGGGSGLLGSIGKFLGLGGKSSLGREAASYLSVPGYATGGSFMVGGKSGIDKNILSINGVPKAMVSSSERIDVTPANDTRGPSHIEVVPSPYFNVVVDGRAAGVAGSMYASGSRTMNRRQRARLA